MRTPRAPTVARNVHVFGIGVQNPLGVPIQTSVDLPAQWSNAFSALPQTLPARTYSELFL
jgi:hypothetical protein